MPELPARPFLVSGVDPCDAETIEKVLAELGQKMVFAERWEPAKEAFTPAGFAGLIILGDDKDWATSPLYQRDRDWLITALSSKSPVLGICFGAQLIAAYLTGRIGGGSLAEASECHWMQFLGVELRGPGLTDPVVKHFARGVPVPQCHKDSFQVPPTATRLAWSKDVTPEHCEAFRLGDPEDAVYGLQFHPEPTEEMLMDRRKKYRWFDKPQPPAELKQAVERGKNAIRAWAMRAIARHSTRTVPAPDLTSE